jgi:oligopeptidase B
MMRHFAPIALALSFALLGCQTPAPIATSKAPVPVQPAALPAPPIAKRVDFAVSSPFGTRNDPYYWLRDDSRTNPAMLAYLTAENDYTKAYFAPLEAQVAQLFSEMKARIKEDDSSVPELRHGYWYYSRFSVGQQYPLYARRKGTMQASEEVLLDGNALAAEQKASYFRVGSWDVTPDGARMVYALDFVGRRQYTLYVKDLATGSDMGVKIEKVTANVVWANNDSYFYTDDNDETLLPDRLYRASIKAPTAAPALVYQELDNTFYLGVGLSKSERYLLIRSGSTLTSETRVIPAATPTAAAQLVLKRERGHEYSVDHFGSHFYIHSNRTGSAAGARDKAAAKNFALYRANETLPSQPARWQPLLAARSDALIEGFELFKSHIAVSERSGGLQKIRLIANDAALSATAVLAGSTLLQADDSSYAMSLQSTPELGRDVVRYEYDSLRQPSSTFEQDLTTGQRTLLKQDPVLGDFNADDYASEYLHATARDGTLIPISLVYKKTTPRDGSAPLYQYAYGSYGSSSDPYFAANRLSLLNRGFVFAIAHIRGGQEMGREWYENGKLLKKINTFTDFIDVSQYLVAQRYCAKDRLVAAGGSAGGLLMGAVINMAPQNYRAVAAHVPFVDVVTTMLDESIPLTTGEFDEWGNPKEKASYDYMLSYSPYDQVRAQDYPLLYVTTGLHDSQVQYFEPAKWVAKLRATKTDSNALVFRINMQAGHGGRSGRFDRLQEVAQEYAFFLNATNVPSGAGASTPDATSANASK